MSVQTQVIWNWPVDQATNDAIVTQLNLVLDKETQPQQEQDGPGAGQKTKLHWWVDEASALDWIAFVEPYNPVSATIVN